MSHSAHLHPSSEAATGSRWDDGAQPRCWCICLHTVLPTMARGCDSSRKTRSVSTQDMLGTSKIFSDENVKDHFQTAMLYRLQTQPIMGIFHRWRKVQPPLTQRQHLACIQVPIPNCDNTRAFLKKLAIIFDIKKPLRCFSYHCWKQINSFIWHCKKLNKNKLA